MNQPDAGQPGHPQATAAEQQQEAAQSDFAPTRPEEDGDQQPGWWPESADGQCSENAGLFAASQSAPLSIV